MHGLLFGIGHATIIAIVGFFVLFAASKAEGLLKLIGNVLGIWLFVLAVLAIAAGLLWGGHGYGMMGDHHGWTMRAPAAAPVAAPTSNAAAPNP